MLNLNIMPLIKKDTKEEYIAIFCTKAKSHNLNDNKILSIAYHLEKQGFINKSHKGNNTISKTYFNCLNNGRLHNALATKQFYNDYTVKVNNNKIVTGDIKLFKSNLDSEFISGMFEK